MYGFTVAASEDSMRKKKKTSKVLLPAVMLAIAMALFIAYLALSGEDLPSDNTGTVDTTNDVHVIVQKDAATVTELAYTLRGAEKLAFTYNANTYAWTYAADPAYPLSGDYLDSMAAAISYIGVYRTLETGDTGVYGFEDPAVTVDVLYTDGIHHRYAIGDQNNMTGYHYFKDLNTGTVYTIDPALLPYFEVSLEDMFAWDTIPDSIEEPYITSLSLEGEGAKNSLSDLADDAKEDIYAALKALTPTDCADWSGSEDALTSYSIGDTTVTIHYRRQVTSADESNNEITTRVAASYPIRFGTITSDGKVPYVLPSSHVIYLADAACLRAFTSLFE